MNEDLRRATRLTEALLEEMRLDTYLFEVEPRGTTLEVRLECPSVDGAWQTHSLPLPPELLVRSQSDSQAKDALFDLWRTRLVACRRAD